MTFLYELNQTKMNVAMSNVNPILLNKDETFCKAQKKKIGADLCGELFNVFNVFDLSVDR